MKKFLIIIMVFAMAVSMLVGCSPSSGEGGSSEPPATSEVPDKPDETPDASDPSGTDTNFGDVEIWYYWETEGHQVALDSMIQKYNALGQGTVAAKYVPFADFKKQLSIGASAEELPDMVIIDSPDHASYASMGIFADLTGRIDVNGYYDGPIASCTLDEKLYGIPFGSNCLSLYYNVDMLEDAGVQPPKTWDELKAAAQSLTRNNVTGLAFCCLQNEEGTFNFMPWVWSTGATSFEIGTDKGMKALDFVAGLVEDGSMTKEVINWTQGDVMNQFISGNVAMMVNGPWQVPTMRSEAPNLNWDVTLIPKDAEYASVLGGENYAAINGGNEDGALAFLTFATEPEQITFMMDTMGYISAKSDVAETQFSDDPIMQKFVEQMKYAQPRGPHADWPSISDAISLAFNEVITGASSAEEAGVKAQATIDSIIR